MLPPRVAGALSSAHPVSSPLLTPCVILTAFCVMCGCHLQFIAGDTEAWSIRRPTQGHQRPCHHPFRHPCAFSPASRSDQGCAMPGGPPAAQKAHALRHSPVFGPRSKLERRQEPGRTGAGPVGPAAAATRGPRAGPVPRGRRGNWTPHTCQLQPGAGARGAGEEGCGHQAPWLEGRLEGLLHVNKVGCRIGRSECICV